MKIGSKWVKMLPKNHIKDYLDCKPNDPIETIEATLKNIECQQLKMKLPPAYLFDSDKTSKNNLKYASLTADSMLKDFFEKGKGRGINIHKPNGGFFEKSESKYDTVLKKWRVKNKNPFEDYTQVFSCNDSKKSYIKELLYDPETGNTEAVAETLSFDFKNYDKLKKLKTYQSEVLGEFPKPEYGHLKFHHYLEPEHNKYFEPEYGFSPLYNPYFAWKADNIGINFEENKKRNKLRKIKRNLTIIVKSRAQPINDIPENEWTALNTLREMISEADFRKYLKYGFILVRGQSDFVYQVFRDQSHTKVWKKGKVIKEICVRIEDDNIPPTDNVIAFKVLIEGCEKEFEKLGNIYNMAEAA